MGPRIIEYLNGRFHTGVFQYLVPDPAVVYAVMLGAGATLFVRRCRARGLDGYHASGMVIWASIAALLGARLFYLVQNMGEVAAQPSMLLELNGATVSFGVYIGGVLGAAMYFRMRGVAPWEYLDAAASVMGIGPLLGRFACFLNGDDYGTLSNLPWAVQFPHGSYPFLDQVARGWISPMADLSLPVHPVQLYGCVKGLLLLVVFSALWKKKLFKPGVLFALFWITYASARFVLEFFRGDDDRGFVGALSTGQAMAIVLIIASLGMLWWKYGRRRERAAEPSAAGESD